MTLPVRFFVYIAAALACVDSVSPQQAATRSKFVVKKGKDTVAIEIFSRDAGTLTSEIYQSNGIRTQYSLDLRPDSRDERQEHEEWREPTHRSSVATRGGGHRPFRRGA